MQSIAQTRCIFNVIYMRWSLSKMRTKLYKKRVESPLKDLLKNGVTSNDFKTHHPVHNETLFQLTADQIALQNSPRLFG
mgnify:CR=1 FL=1